RAQACRNARVGQAGPLPGRVAAAPAALAPAAGRRGRGVAQAARRGRRAGEAPAAPRRAGPTMTARAGRQPGNRERLEGGGARRGGPPPPPPSPGWAYDDGPGRPSAGEPEVLGARVVEPRAEQGGD